MAIEDRYDVVIIGAGAIGLCTARELAPTHDVLVLEKDRIEDSASANANAFISDWWYLLEGKPVPGVFEKIRDFFTQLDGTGEFEYNPHPCLVLFDKETKNSKAGEKFKRMRENAGDIDGVSYLDKEEIKARWPDELNLDGFEGGVVDEKAGCISPLPYVKAIKKQAEERGADFRMGKGVTEIVTEDDEFAGVAVEGESEVLHPDKVVVAAGTHSKELVSDFTDLPTKPFVIYGHRIKAIHENLTQIPITTGRGFLIGPDPYGSLTLVGGEYWIEDFGDVDTFPEEFPDDAREHVADRLPELLSRYKSESEIQYRDDQLHRCPEGITITPDQLPVIDTVDDSDSVIVADGSRGAVSAAPAISSVIHSLISGEQSEIPQEPFSIDRFDSTPLEYDLPLITPSPS